MHFDSSLGLKIASSTPSTATRRVQIANDKISIYNDDSNYAYINSDGLTLYKGGSNVANFGTTARIGKDGGSRFLINDSSLQAYYMNGSTPTLYFQVTPTGMSYGPSANNMNTVATSSDIANIKIGGTNLVRKIDRGYHATNEEIVFTRGAKLCSTNIIFEDRTLIAARTGNTSTPYTAEKTTGETVTISFDYKLNTGGTSRAISVYPYQQTGLSTLDNLPGFTPTGE